MKQSVALLLVLVYVALPVNAMELNSTANKELVQPDNIVKLMGFVQRIIEAPDNKTVAQIRQEAMDSGSSLTENNKKEIDTMARFKVYALEEIKKRALEKTQQK
ncbi:MAG: hypothetical protein WCE21_00505 [Candidatus Babeliales bacterium]